MKQLLFGQFYRSNVNVVQQPIDSNTYAERIYLYRDSHQAHKTSTSRQKIGAVAAVNNLCKV